MKRNLQDTDPDGLGIADRLWERFGDAIHMWRMSPADYRKSVSRESMGRTGMTKLEHIEHLQLKETAECIKEKGLVGYQENILTDLLADMMTNFSD